MVRVRIGPRCWGHGGHGGPVMSATRLIVIKGWKHPGEQREHTALLSAGTCSYEDGCIWDQQVYAPLVCLPVDAHNYHKKLCTMSAHSVTVSTWFHEALQCHRGSSAPCLQWPFQLQRPMALWFNMVLQCHNGPWAPRSPTEPFVS